MYIPAFTTNPVMRTQAIAATAEALSGVSELDLRRHKANMVWLTVEGADLRYAWDGTSPTSGIGHLLPEGQPLLIEGQRRILNFRMLGDAAAAVTVTFTLDNTSEAGGTQ